MKLTSEIFCIDTNVLIEAWQRYYSPEICLDYWKILNEIGAQGRIFISEVVFDEIKKSEDDLFKWLKDSNISVKKIDESVSKCLQDIYSKNEIHKYLVDNTKLRSLADPWIIAHAINERATVVTKEEKVTALNSRRIKIPNVCDNMGIRCINDFQLIRELNIKFSCEIKG